MRTSRITFACLVLTAVFFIAGHSQAGSQYELKCTDCKCGFKTSVGIGGCFMFGEIGGYCDKCDKWVVITYNSKKEKAPTPIAEFWDPSTGELRQIYKCPTCQHPFVFIKDVKEIKFCPKCKKACIESKRSMFYD